MAQYEVRFYRDGRHDEPVRTLSVRCERADVSNRVQQLKAQCCCWEALDQEGIVAYCLCKDKGWEES